MLGVAKQGVLAVVTRRATTLRPNVSRLSGVAGGLGLVGEGGAGDHRGRDRGPGLSDWY